MLKFLQSTQQPKGKIVQILAQGIQYVGADIHPAGTAIPAPRLYFQVDEDFDRTKAQGLENFLRNIFKHVTSVCTCTQTGHKETASFYVTFGGFDPNARSTPSKVQKYLDDICREICNWFRR